ncbi:MAG: hypothetical protein LBG57_04020 [Treponema sp.]|nr:hypothetical protein [Treponema sp.]
MEKQALFGVCGALLALSLVLTGCPTEANDSPPSGKIGEKTLTLKGTVYTVSNSTTFTKAGAAYDGEVDGKPGGSGKITKGEFTFSVEPLDVSSGPTLNAAALSVLIPTIGLYTDVTVSPDVKYAVLLLDPDSGAILEHKNSAAGSDSVKTERVTYIYLSGAVKITGKKSSGTSGKLDLSLVKGWNIIYEKNEVKASLTSSSSVKVEKHSLKWVITP